MKIQGESEEYWDELPSVDCEGAPMDGLVIEYTYDAPQLVPSFIEYFNLIETQPRIFQPYDEDIDVTKFPYEKEMAAESGASDDTIREFKVRKSYLKDYLKERDAVLVLAHWQQRDVRSAPPDEEITTPNGYGRRIHSGPAVIKPLADMPGSGFIGADIAWICPVSPDDLGLGHAEELMAKCEDLRFRTHEGRLFSKDDVVNQRGFSEAGLQRPAVGATSLEEHINLFDFLSFSPDVLERYRRDDRGSVSEWSEQGLSISWIDQMRLRAYRNSSEDVVIIIDDLEKIPDGELSHWPQHNKSPSGNLPEEMISNYFEVEWVDSRSPSGALIESMTNVNREFMNATGKPLFQDSISELNEDLLITLSRNQRDELLEVMGDVDSAVIENVDVSNVKSFLDNSQIQDIEGEKSALFELMKFLRGEEGAIRLITPFNIIHDLRLEESHRNVSGGWERAMKDLSRDEDADDFREMYRDILFATSDSFNEICDYLRYF